MQTQQLVVTLSGHSDAVNAVAWDSSGKYIASGCREVYIWDFTTHERIITPKLNDPGIFYIPPIRAIAFDCAGDYIAVSCSKCLMLFTTKPIANAKLVWYSGYVYVDPLRESGLSLNAIAFDPSGRHLIANDYETGGSLRIWIIDVKPPSAFLSGVESTSVVTNMTSSPSSAPPI
jgi:WD40 repeat protein